MAKKGNDLTLSPSANTAWDSWAEACGFTSWDAAAKAIGLTKAGIFLARSRPMIRRQTSLAMAACLAGLKPYATVRRCRFCGCTDTQACPDICWWTGSELCSTCTPTIDETLTALCLVGDCGHITEAQVDIWSADQRADAFAWAMALHQHASDNDDVKVPARPAHTMPSPLQQQQRDHTAFTGVNP